MHNINTKTAVLLFSSCRFSGYNSIEDTLSRMSEDMQSIYLKLEVPDCDRVKE